MTRLQEILFPTLGLLAIVVIAVGCYPTHGMSVEDYDTVVTGYNPATNFSKYKTFSMPDTIIHVGSETDKIISRKYDKVILSTIATNFELLGYRRIIDTVAESPDVRVFVAATGTTFESYYGGGWGGYWGWYGGWYGGYPPYYGGVYVTSTDVGAISVDMVNTKIGTPTVSAWGGVLSGIAGGISQSYLVGKVNQLFVQSPYLATGDAQ